MRIWNRSCLSLLTVLLSACGAGTNKPNVEVVQDMMWSPAIKAQDSDLDNKDQLGMMYPPEGTVPMGFEPYRIVDPAKAGQILKNPFSGDLSPEIIQLGKQQYDIYCAVCHGNKGLGGGPVADKMPLKPPSLVTDKMENWKDGRIFHVITRGQGVMGAYNTQITDPDKRWKIVNYIRSLQKLSMDGE